MLTLALSSNREGVRVWQMPFRLAKDQPFAS